MLKRVGESVVVAMASAVVVWILDHPGKGQSAMHNIVNAIGRFGETVRTPVLVVALIFTALALVFVVNGWRRQRVGGGSSWELGLNLPSGPTVLFGVAVALLLVWVGFGACMNGHAWGLVPTAAAVWMCARFVSRVRRAWSYESGLL